MRMRWSEDLKRRAVELRNSEKSLGEIYKELGIPKTTVFEWLRRLPKPERFSRPENWLRLAQIKGVEALKKEKTQRMARIADESNKEVLDIGNLNTDSKKMMLSMLYWAEGAKTGGTIQFVNVDPRLCFLFMKLFRDCYIIDESKFRVRLHLHYYHRLGVVAPFWSKLLNIPISQFGKPYWKTRSKEKTFRRNFGGICTIRYNDVNLKERILQYGYSLAERICGRFNAPVAQRIERAPAKGKI